MNKTPNNPMLTRTQSQFRKSELAPKQKIKENKLFVILTCIYIFSWYMQIGNRISLLDTIRFEFLLGAFLSISAILVLFSQNTKATPLKGPIMLYLSVLTFYTVFSYDHATSWDIFYNRVIKFSMLALFFAAFIRTPWALKMAIGAFLLAMLKLGQEGFVGWYTGNMVWENQGVPRLRGTTPLYRHPNSFSGMAVGCLPFIYFLYPVLRSFWHKLSLLLLLFFCSIIIVFTASRTGYVATGLLIIYAVFKLKGRYRNNILLSIAVLLPLSLSFIPSKYIERFESIFTLDEAEGESANTRMQIIEDALYIAASKPWGVGVAAFPKVREDMFGRAQDTHNLYLELLTNLSIIGLLVFLLLIRKIIKLNIRLQASFSKTNNSDLFILSAISKATIGFILSRLFLGIFGMDTYEIYWWFAIGITISLVRASALALEAQKH